MCFVDGKDTLVGAVSNQNWVEMLSFAEQAELFDLEDYWITEIMEVLLVVIECHVIKEPFGVFVGSH